MEINITIVAIFILCLIVGFIIGRLSKKVKYDGIIIIDEADSEGHAGMNLEFGINYDQLMQREYLIFKVDNNLKIRLR